MPHLRFRGLEKNELLEISSNILEDISELTSTPKDHFTMEYIESIFIFDGKENGNRYPFVSVDWFARGEEMMEKTARIITNAIKKYGYEDVAVYFTDLEKARYYENGEHF